MLSLTDVLKMAEYRNPAQKALLFLQSMVQKETQVQTLPSKDHPRGQPKCDKILQATNEEGFIISDSIFSP